MPTLQRRDDGGFFIHHFYRDHNTWQILGDGVRYLERRGVKEGGRFSTDTFMRLWMLGLIYYGNTPANRPAAIPPGTGVVAALRNSVRAFHRLLYSARVDSAWPLILQSTPETLSFAQFSREVSGDDRRKLVSWQIQDIVGVYDLPADLGSSLDGAKRAAVVAVEICLADTDKREMKQLWLELNAQWRIWWNGFDG